MIRREIVTYQANNEEYGYDSQACLECLQKDDSVLKLHDDDLWYLE